MAYASNEIELDDIFSVYLLRRKNSLENNRPSNEKSIPKYQKERNDVW